MAFTPESLPDLSGRVYIVTGGNAGIGFNTVSVLAAHNAKVCMGARSVKKATDAIQQIRLKHPEADIEILYMNMMDLETVKEAAEDFLRNESRLHGLVNNAGIMATPYEESKDGFEAQFQTNYLSHWLLTYLLVPTLARTAESCELGTVRITNVSSDGHIFAPAAGIDFDDINQLRGGIWSRYGMSKLANVLHAKELSRRYGPPGPLPRHGEIWTASLHPGTSDTNLVANATASWAFQLLSPVLRAFGGFMSVDKAAYTSLYVTASQDFSRRWSGEYFKPVGVVGKASACGNDMVLADKLWQWTEQEMIKRGLVRQ